MNRYPAYPEYKSTGCDWFPEIPSHWEIDRAKWSVTSCQNGVWGAEPDGDGDLVCIRVADFDRQSLRVSTEKLTMRSIAEKDRRNRLLRAGDLLLEKSGGGEQQLVGAVVEFNGAFAAVSSNFIARMVVSDEMDPRFLVYLHSHLYSGRVNFRSIKQTTGIQNLDSQAYLDEPITYPPLDEQKAIARFLDFKTTQIDSLISKKKALLDKLTEKRTALISHAVTKGLDPTVAMKDSGVAWLGNVPAHWKVIPIKFSLDMPITDGPHSTPQFYDDGIPFISAESVKNDRLDFSRMRGYISEDDHAIFSKKYKPKYGDVYMVKSGATTGAVARVETHEDFNIWSPLAVLRPSAEKSITDYLFYVLKSKPFFYSVELSWSYGTQQNIGMGVISNIRMALPPVEEQQEICQHLEPLLQKIEDQRAKVDCVVERLHEYRSALITNAVTGKIDVRGFKIPQPAEGSAA